MIYIPPLLLSSGTTLDDYIRAQHQKRQTRRWVWSTTVLLYLLIYCHKTPDNGVASLEFPTILPAILLFLDFEETNVQNKSSMATRSQIKVLLDV
jgi:hypothetical protein